MTNRLLEIGKVGGQSAQESCCKISTSSAKSIIKGVVESEGRLYQALYEGPTPGCHDNNGHIFL